MSTTGQFSSYAFGSGNPAILDKMKDVAYDPEASTFRPIITVVRDHSRPGPKDGN